MALNIKLLAVVLYVLLVVPVVPAYILDEHKAILDDAFDETRGTPLTEEVFPYKDYVIACNELVDISIVTYFNKDCDSGLFSSAGLLCLFKFDIGKPYKATHSPAFCLRSFEVANAQADPVLRAKYRACSVGICTHGIHDADSHGHAVNLAVEHSLLTNGLVHSPKEIYDKNVVTNAEDRVETRQVLDLAYEMTPFFEQVLVNDPAFSQVQVPELIDFFVKQVQGSNEYDLGFRSFFSIPSFILWLVALLFLVSLSLLAVMVRRIRFGDVSVPIVFVGVFALLILVVDGLAIYGVFVGSLWSMWEVLSQILFSPWMYVVSVLFFVIGVWLIFDFFRSRVKKELISHLFVAAFLLFLGVVLLRFPSALDTGDPHTIYRISVEHTKMFLTQGVLYVRGIEDPSGTEALRIAEEAGSGARLLFLIILSTLLSGIIYFALRKSEKGGG